MQLFVYSHRNTEKTKICTKNELKDLIAPLQNFDLTGYHIYEVLIDEPDPVRAIGILYIVEKAPFVNPIDCETEILGKNFMNSLKGKIKYNRNWYLGLKQNVEALMKALEE